MGKFSLNQIPTLNHKFTIANSFILIRPSIRRQSLSYEFVLCVGGIMKVFCLFIFFALCFLRFPGNAP